ncbi:unnamed protein product [Durusdinium trenchii]|uniref:Cellulase n=1 Tax=Durusdinium trenchii TaxID=1381693 RepID=A0ABP0Q8A1_9DINO
MPWVPATNGKGAAPLHLTAFSRIAHPIHPKAEACYLSDSQQRSKDSLTNQPVNGSDARAVHSSGGAAGGVVSEGQGYGVLLTGAFLAMLTPEDEDWEQMKVYFYQMFLGWRRMCEYSKEDSCQEDAGFLCDGNPCLPHWKFDDNLTTVLGKGSAPDGDEDAMTGMLLAVLSLTRQQQHDVEWLAEVGTWTYNTCKQFFLSETIASSSGKNRIVKLGACWGGWGDDGQNPSYHSPGAYRLCRDFMTQGIGSSDAEGASYVSKWNKVISTSYKMFDAVQCHSNGLITNWARVWESADGVGPFRADANFTGSGTPGAQYGSEASRTTWRVALDYLLYPKEAMHNATQYLDPLVVMLESKESHCDWASELRIDDACLVTSVHPDWSWNMFIAGPTFSSLVVPAQNDGVSIKRQQELINAGGARVAKGGFSSGYYSGSWVAISTFTLNGDFLRSASMAGLYGDPPAPSPPPTPAPTPTPSRCSTPTEDCRSTRCCQDPGYTCYEKDQYWAGCRESCTPGIHPNEPPEHQTPWSCEVLRCSSSTEDCRSTGCCEDAAYTCYEKDSTWAGCRSSCAPGEVNPLDPPEHRTPWSCHVVDVL